MQYKRCLLKYIDEPCITVASNIMQKPVDLVVSYSWIYIYRDASNECTC